ncbi:MAG: glycosyltransferase family 4 protein [Actinobacteria bacterium]|nr:MAG: glycosyltransferase family 4 protein [Actinomycetota bacterium]
MRIAQLAPPWIQVPPSNYGGIEWVVALLCDELVRRGHDVTLFATGDSRTKAHLRYVFDLGQTEKMGECLPDAMHVSAAFQSAGEFDLIHDHSGFLGVAFSSFIETPVLHTLHGAFTSDVTKFYTAFAESCYYNAISEYQRGCCPSLRYVDTVYNAIDVEDYPFSNEKEGFALMISRISPDKGTHLAIKVAQEAGIRLVLAGKIDSGVDQRYFESMVEPGIDGDRVRFVGEVTESEKRQLMSSASCFLFPIQWPEPFGLVMAEAMAAGTPVVAIRNGSVPEVVRDGKTGFVVDTPEEMVPKIAELGEIDPRECRSHVERNFSPSKMAEAYERNYWRILEEAVEPSPAFAVGTSVRGGTDDISTEPRFAGAAERAGKPSGRNGDRERHRRHNLPDSSKS